MSVTQVQAWADGHGGLHKTKESAEAANLSGVAERFVNRAPPPDHARPWEVAYWLLGRRKELHTLAANLNPKESA